jgi:peptidoglycan-associated lipoprotein
MTGLFFRSFEMLKQILVAAVVVGSVAVTGCASKGKKNTAPPPVSNTDSGMTGYGATDNNVSGSGLGDLASQVASKKVIYFDYDSADLTSDGQATASLWARYLAANPSVRVRLEGNTDERGTREYNIALGESRANTVQAALTSGGASASQISVVSYGEERPAAPGHDESAWSLNRRVEFVQQ